MTHKSKASAKAGMLPGSAVYVGENPPLETKLLIHIYDKENYQKTDFFDPLLLHSALEKGQHIWIDVCGLADTKQITTLCKNFAIHPLIIEDILSTHQRPKLDDLGDTLFVVFKLLDPPKGQPRFKKEQFSMVLQKNLLITFRESENYDLNSLYKRLSTETSLIGEQHCGYLSFLIIDRIIDDYFTLVEQGEDTLTAIEDLLIKDPPSISLNDLYTIKRRTMTLRKVIAPLRDILHRLAAQTNHLVAKEFLIYYEDLFDHSERLLDSLNLQREMITGILEIYLSTLNNRMNETMKVLTVFASLFIPLTFIVGIYGMNFVYMPELKWRYSYPAVLLFMLVLALCMIYYFKRKKLI